jgi:hypothetical protein
VQRQYGCTGACCKQQQGHGGGKGEHGERSVKHTLTRQLSSSTMADVEMKPVDEKEKKEQKMDEKKDEKKEESKPIPLSPVAEIKSNLVLIERAVSTLEPRFTHRVLRTLTSLRKRIDEKILRDAIEEVYPKGMMQPISRSHR